jgi:hypothetical protein
MADGKSIKLLHDAREKAQKLLDVLLKKQQELDETPTMLEADQIEKGRSALSGAIAATQKTLDNLDQAIQIASSM